MSYVYNVNDPLPFPKDWDISSWFAAAFALNYDTNMGKIHIHKS